MSRFNDPSGRDARLRAEVLRKVTAIFVASLLILPPAQLGAKTKKADKLRNDARTEEVKGNYDHALELAEQAMAQDPGDPSYVLLVRRIRFEAASAHVKSGQKLRSAGKLDEALAEFEKAFGIDPASDIAAQEVRRTRDMIDRNKTGGPSPVDRKALTPSELAKRESQDRTDSLLPVPELRPLNGDLIDLKMTNKPRILFETVAKVAGVNVLFDPEYNQQQTIPQVQIDLSRTTLDQALDQLAVVTKSFWKPLSQNTIFVTVDNPTKRREYAEQVVKVFYLSNVTAPQEMQELLTVLRTVVDVQKVFNYTAQNALVVRAEADTMALVEKLISDLDKSRPEVVIDIVVMEVSSSYMRSLTTALASTGITSSANFAPRPGITTPGSTTSGTSTSTTGTTTSTTGTTTTTPTTSGTSTGTSVPLANLGHIASSDFSLTGIPGATFEAVMTDSRTKVLQSPRIRAVDNAKASIKIGDKVPMASGSFQPGVGSVGVSPLVNTQFTFIDVGVNVEITPKIHDNNEVSLHIDLDVSQVTAEINLGGIQEPEIGQNKMVADVRLRDGEVNLIGGIIQQTDSKSLNGIPGLASIPVIGRLFSGDTTEKDRTELVIAIIPHILRGQEVTSSNLRGVAAGNATQIKVGYLPRTLAPAATAPGTAVPADQRNASAPAAPPATAPPVGTSALPPAAAPPATAPAMAPPATASPAPTPPGPIPPRIGPNGLPPGVILPGGPQPGAGPPGATSPGGASPGVTPGSAALGAARVSFLPANGLETQLSQSVTVTIYAENVKDLVQSVASLGFDPKILRVTNIVAGDLPQRNGKQVQPAKNILNDSGVAEATLTRGAGDPGVSGSGGLFQIVLQAVGRGNTMLTLKNVSMSAPGGRPIPSNVPPPLAVSVK